MPEIRYCKCEEDCPIHGERPEPSDDAVARGVKFLRTVPLPDASDAEFVRALLDACAAPAPAPAVTEEAVWNALTEIRTRFLWVQQHHYEALRAAIRAGAALSTPPSAGKAEAPLPITAQQADMANRLIEKHCPAAPETTDVQVALGHLAQWIRTNRQYPRPASTPPRVGRES